MPDRVPKSELDLLREEVERLRREVEELRAGEPPRVKRRGLWARLFGRLVFDGKEQCSECAYADELFMGKFRGEAPEEKRWLVRCSLVSNCYAKELEDTCERFEPDRKYMREVRG